MPKRGSSKMPKATVASPYWSWRGSKIKRAGI